MQELEKARIPVTNNTPTESLFEGGDFIQPKTLIEAGVYRLRYTGDAIRGVYTLKDKETEVETVKPKISWPFDCIESDNEGTKPGDLVVFQSDINYGGPRAMLTRIVNGLASKPKGLRKDEWAAFDHGIYAGNDYEVLVGVDVMAGSEYNEIVKMTIIPAGLAPIPARK